MGSIDIVPRKMVLIVQAVVVAQRATKHAKKYSVSDVLLGDPRVKPSWTARNATLAITPEMTA